MILAVTTAEHLSGIGGFAREPKPQHIDRRAQTFDLQTGSFAHDRLAAVTADSQLGSDLQLAFRSFCFDADDLVAGLQYIDDFGLHHQLKGRTFPGFVGEEIQKVPLRHEAEKFTMRR